MGVPLGFTHLWERTVRGSGSASALPIAVDGKVFIQEEEADYSMSLVCLDGSSGSVLWRTNVESMAISWGAPVLLNNVIYLATDHMGGLYAFDAGAVNGNWYMIKQNPELTGSDHGWVPAAETPTAPTLSFTITGTAITLSWSPVANADGYTLFYAPPDISYIGQVDMESSTSISVDLWSGFALYVAVQAYNSAGNSDYSNIEYFVIP